mgnify:CR=1 FL=1
MRKSKSNQTHTTTEHAKALALISGGLDSTLATALLIRQGIKVEGIFFSSPFCQCNRKGGCQAVDIAKALGIRLKTITKDEEYIEVVRKPKHGYGKGMNPCIDCRIFMLRKAKEYAKKIGASFLVTGEVLGERPMSQHRRALEVIERESGLKGLILRPLSAKLLPSTKVEKNLVDRDKLLDISGRSRKRQIELAEELKIKGYACAAGGCLLTDKNFAKRLKDLFKAKEKVTTKDIELLKVGRHFRYGSSKIIVGRNEEENTRLLSLKGKSDYYFEVQEYGSPITLLQGNGSEEALRIAASLTAHYSDCDNDPCPVGYGKTRLDRTISAPKISEEEIDRLRI